MGKKSQKESMSKEDRQTKCQIQGEERKVKKKKKKKKKKGIIETKRVKWM